ncbi:helix-turn-helix domain-containing protein [Flavobacterium chuncheonense]|uniref:Helix-turn-helix domain-containing protein n=1 Tax=Flavobacterium chuncheonense TaxID=2026653 RepID=A0ABW5YJP1_9FLAO
MNPKIYMLCDEGIKVLAEQIAEKVKIELQNTTTVTPEEKFLNIDELSKFIGLTKPTIYGHVHRNSIPFIKKGKMLRFSKSDILNWLKEGKSQSKNQLDATVDQYLANNPFLNLKK